MYEYQCQACSREFEYQQRMADPDKTTCEVCGGSLERLISRTAFSLKGGGWYKDLYASPKPEKSDAKPEGKSDGKSDAPAASSEKADKPAAKTESGSGSAAPSSGSTGSAAPSSGGGSTGGGGSSSSSAAASKVS